MSLALAVLIVITPHRNATAQTPPEMSESEQRKTILELSKSLADYFAPISALSFKSSLQWAANPKFAVEGDMDLTKGRQTGTFALELQGNRFRADDRMNTGSQAEQFDQIIAYDGSRYQVFNYSERLLRLKSVRPADEKTGDVTLRFTNFFLRTFEFFSTNLTKRYESALNLAEFQTPDCAAAFAKRIVSVEPPARPDGNVTVRIEAGTDATSGLPVFYLVEFSTSEGYFPKGWRRVDILNRTLATFDVTETAVFVDPAGRRFKYPKRVTFRNYGGDPATPIQAAPVFTKTVDLTDFKVNSPGESHDPFTIDPAMADQIFDEDLGTVTRVPR